MAEQMKLRGKRVLVTGGAGFIGSHTTEALLDAGASVIVFDNFSTGSKGNLPDAAALDVVKGDVRDLVQIRDAMRDCDAVIHLAAQVSVRASVDDPVNSAQHNVLGFINVLEAARRRRISRIVYASSAAVYGIPKSVPLDENSPTGPISPYGLEKLIDEQYAAMYTSLYALKCLGLRYFNVYGPRQDPASPYAGVITKFVERINAGEPVTIFGSGEQTRDFVWVQDVARVNLAAVAGGTEGILAVGTGRSVSLLELLKILSSCAGKCVAVRHSASVPGDIEHSSMNPDVLRQVMGCAPSTALEQGLRHLTATLG